MRAKKYRIRITAFFLCLLMGCSSSAALAADLFTDVQFFGGTGRDTIYEALPLQNGNLLLVCATQEGRDGRAQLSSGDTLGWLVCLAPDGSVAWEKTYGSLPGANVVARPVQQADGTIAIWNHHSVNQRMDAVRVLTLTEDGEEISRSERGVDWPFIQTLGENYWITDYDNAQYLLQTPEGQTLFSTPESQTMRNADHPIQTEDGIVMVGWLSAPDYNNAGVAKVSRGGAPMWQTEIKSSEQTRLTKCIETSEGNILAVGNTSEMLADGSYNSHGLAVLLGKNGNILWQQEYELGKGGFIFTDVVETPTGYVAMYPSQNHTQVDLMLMDKQGNEMKRGSFRMGDDGYSSPGFVQWNGGIWVIDRVERKGSEDDVLLMRLDMEALLRGE